jgi:DnaJ-class molecular chaperone
MSEDPYKVLGVSKNAGQDEIKKAYRKKAKELHPDLHPGDKAKQEAFKTVSAAYDILGDAEKRRRFDAGEIDASGQERPERQYYHQYAGADPRGRYESASGFGDFEDVSDIFADLFGGRARGGGAGFGGGGAGPRGAGGAPFSARGADARYHLDVDFLDAARGAKRTLPLPDGSTIGLTIPAGVSDGQTLRLRGKGQPGRGDGPPGDALVEIGIRPHPLFTRDGNDIALELPITFDEAVLGAKVEVPTIDGRVTMTVPKGASSGRRMRLKGKGIRPAKGHPGDQNVRLKIVLPEQMDGEMAEIAERWRNHVRHDPRAGLGG